MYTMKKWEKNEKKSCAGSSLTYFLNIGDYLPPCVFMPAWWTLPPASPRQLCLKLRQSNSCTFLSWGEGCWDRETKRWGVWSSTLASSAAFSGSRRAGLRELPEFPAQLESSRTRPPRLLLACTVSCRRWSRQKMVGRLLWMAHIQHRWANTQQHSNMTHGRRDGWAYPERYQWRRPPKAHWWQGR